MGPSVVMVTTWAFFVREDTLDYFVTWAICGLQQVSWIFLNTAESVQMHMEMCIVYSFVFVWYHDGNLGSRCSSGLARRFSRFCFKILHIHLYVYMLFNVCIHTHICMYTHMWLW